MRLRVSPTLMLVAACVFATGCGLNTAVLQKGGNGRMGVLLNYSCGAAVCDPIDPAKPTIVITHGWNPLPNRIRTTFGSAAAAAIKSRCGDSYNLLSWDWNGVRISPFNDEPLRVGREQGRMLAAALRARGLDPSQTQIIGHSLGTIVATQAAVCLQDLGPTAQLTLLDAPETYHETIFYDLAPTCHAAVVENYWSPGLSGYGARVPLAGVQNHEIRGETPVVGVVDLSMSNHVYVMRWYYNTIRCPTMPCGFQNCVFISHCDRADSVGGVSDADSASHSALLSASERPPTNNTQLTATSAGSRRR
ncbi:MAG TPA: hypothetical protein VF175_06070 [Lacipirellula sp.]